MDRFFKSYKKQKKAETKTATSTEAQDPVPVPSTSKKAASPPVKLDLDATTYYDADESFEEASTPRTPVASVASVATPKTTTPGSSSQGTPRRGRTPIYTRVGAPFFDNEVWKQRTSLVDEKGAVKEGRTITLCQINFGGEDKPPECLKEKYGRKVDNLYYCCAHKPSKNK